jgi:hypothetical protein
MSSFPKETLPQLSFTTATRYTCGDGLSKAIFRQDPMTGAIYTDKWLSFHTITPLVGGSFRPDDETETRQTIPQLLNRILGPLPLETGEEISNAPKFCCRDDCPGVSKQMIILDRLPPILVLGFGWEGHVYDRVKNGRSFMTHFGDRFRPFTLKWCDSRSNGHISIYEPLEFVFSRRSSLHYTLRWSITHPNETQRRIQYDSAKGKGYFEEIPSLGHGFDEETSAVALHFYKLRTTF